MTGPDEARYALMRWNTPLAESHAELLLDRWGVAGAADVLDLGCGWGELLVRAVRAGGPGTVGTGVDTDAALLARGDTVAAAAGVADRVTFVAADIAEWTGTASRVACLGASHAWSGTAEALAALGTLVAPGGRLLLGESCWEQAPTAEAAALFEQVLPLTTIVELAHASGWRVLHLSTADQREWDDFESTWRAGRHRWLSEHPDDPAAADVRALLQARLQEYVDVYRGRLGFAYLVLARP